MQRMTFVTETNEGARWRLGWGISQVQRSRGVSVGGAAGGPELVLRDGRESGRKGGQR